ncbi:hypothetical protein [Actinomadura sp. NPDC048394]|uniref:hypothetical protein n=1 Tax=Actinomadura sp. NPDC048394 TaxID=3158223 RepID=UPI0034103F8D
MDTPPDNNPPGPDRDELLRIVADQQATINDLVSALAAMQNAVGGLTQRIETLERRHDPSPGSPSPSPSTQVRNDPGET